MNIKLKKGREKSPLNGHPWVFTGALEKQKLPNEPALVNVCSHDGQNLGLAFWHPKNSLCLRFVRDSNFLNLLKLAFARRESLKKASDALRLFSAETDGIPGLVIDQLSNINMVQFHSLALENFREEIISYLKNDFGCQYILEKSDTGTRKLEGLAASSGWLTAPPEKSEFLIIENNLKFFVDLNSQQKTGFYCDQRQNRMTVSQVIKTGDDVLNAFSFSGGFGLYAARSYAASVINVDSSQEALELAQKNFEINNFSNFTNIKADVFELFRTYVQEKKQFDVVIIDPPKLVKHAHDLEKAGRAYKDLNRLAFQLVKPEGYLATFSCSGHMSFDLFQKIVFQASREARCDAQIIDYLKQDEDHPILLSFPESLYLKGFLLKKNADYSGG